MITYVPSDKELKAITNVINDTVLRPFCYEKGKAHYALRHLRNTLLGIKPVGDKVREILTPQDSLLDNELYQVIYGKNFSAELVNLVKAAYPIIYVDKENNHNERELDNVSAVNLLLALKELLQYPLDKAKEDYYETLVITVLHYFTKKRKEINAIVEVGINTLFDELIALINGNKEAPTLIQLHNAIYKDLTHTYHAICRSELIDSSYKCELTNASMMTVYKLTNVLTDLILTEKVKLSKVRDGISEWVELLYKNGMNKRISGYSDEHLNENAFVFLLFVRYLKID